MIATVIGAVSSVILMLLSGLRPPFFLIVLFIVWVSAPFGVLLLATVFLPSRAHAIRSALLWMSLILAILSVAAYTYALDYPRPSQPAFPYVVVPMVSGVVIVVVLSTAALMRRRDC